MLRRGHPTQSARGNAYNNRGYAFLLRRDPDKAISDYDRAIRIDPKYAKAHFFRGLAYEAKSEQDKAVADYTAAIRFDPTLCQSLLRPGLTSKERPMPTMAHGRR